MMSLWDSSSQEALFDEVMAMKKIKRNDINSHEVIKKELARHARRTGLHYMNTTTSAASSSLPVPSSTHFPSSPTDNTAPSSFRSSPADSASISRPSHPSFDGDEFVLNIETGSADAIMPTSIMDSVAQDTNSSSFTTQSSLLWGELAVPGQSPKKVELQLVPKASRCLYGLNMFTGPSEGKAWCAPVSLCRYELLPLSGILIGTIIASHPLCLI